VVLGGWLDLMTLEIFSNLNDSVIVWKKLPLWCCSKRQPVHGLCRATTAEEGDGDRPAGEAVQT